MDICADMVGQSDAGALLVKRWMPDYLDDFLWEHISRLLTVTEDVGSVRQKPSPSNFDAVLQDQSMYPAPQRARRRAVFESTWSAKSIESVISPQNNQYAMGSTEEPWHTDTPMHLPHVTTSRPGIERNSYPSDSDVSAMFEGRSAHVLSQPNLPSYPNAPTQSTSFNKDMYSMPYPEANIPAWEGYEPSHHADGRLTSGPDPPSEKLRKEYPSPLAESEGGRKVRNLMLACQFYHD